MAVNGRHWRSQFAPTNSVDEHRFDDVRLQNTAAAGRNGGFPFLTAKASSALAEEGSSRGLHFDDGLDAEAEFEVDTGGGRVVFSRAPRGPWMVRRGVATLDRLDSGGAIGSVGGVGGGDSGGWKLQQQQHQQQQLAAQLHNLVRTRPLVADWQAGAQLSLPPQLTAPPPNSPGMSKANGNGGKSHGGGFSLSRLFRRRSLSRSRSSASTSVATTPTPQSGRSRAPSGGASNGKTVQAGIPDSQVNGQEHGGGAPVARSSSFMVTRVLQHPAGRQ